MQEKIEKSLKWLYALYNRPLVFIDFEFNNSSHPVVNLVSCSLSYYNPEVCPDLATVEYWLKDNLSTQAELDQTINRCRDEDAIFVGFMVAAEARCFQALGNDPHDFDWIDLYAEWRQLTFNNNECQYGTYYTKTGFRRKSTPPSFIKEKNKYNDNTAVGWGLVDCVGQMFEIFIDSAHKKIMRDLILENRPVYTPEEQKTIMEYCTSDIKYLPAVWAKQLTLLHKYTDMDFQKLLRVQLRRGEFMCSIAKMETVGFPLDLEKVKHLRRNFKGAQDTLLTNLVTEHYSFYIKEKKRSADLMGTWTEKYINFETFVKEKGLFEKWPHTIHKDTGKSTQTLSRDEKTLELYDGVSEIYAYRQAKKLIKQMAWFQEPTAKKKRERGDFFDAVGPDNHLRTFLGAFGSQTSRNQPKASKFVLAMSAWLRCLISPSPGRIIIGADYSSQEFAIGAIKSQDKQMMQAYRSKDPYAYFATQAGAIPKDANFRWIKHPDEAPIKLQETYKEHKNKRGLFKSTCLGLQYGMGVEKLRTKLSADVGRVFTMNEAQTLVNLHRDVFHRYWKWLDEVSTQYKRCGYISLWDGWCLLRDNNNMLSVKNFPTQGTGGAIMREAIRLSRGMNILGTLHDSEYVEADEREEQTTTKRLVTAMLTGFYTVMGNELEIRIDKEVHTCNEPWVEEEKGRKHYDLLKKYLEYLPNSEDKQKELSETIYTRH